MMFPLPTSRPDGSHGTYPLKVTQTFQLSLQSQPAPNIPPIIFPPILSIPPPVPPFGPLGGGPSQPLYVLPGQPLLQQGIALDANLGIAPSVSLNQSTQLSLPGRLQTLSTGPSRGPSPLSVRATSHCKSPSPILGPPPTVGASPLSQGALSLPFSPGTPLRDIPITTFLSPVGSDQATTETITVVRETTCHINMSRGFPLPVTPYGVVGREALLKSTDLDTLLDGSKKEFMITRAEKVSLWRTFADVFHEQDTKLEVTDKSLLAIFLGLPSHIRRAIRHKGGIGTFLRECPWFLVRGDQVELVPEMEKLYHSQEDDVKETACDEGGGDNVPDSWEELSLSDIDEGGYTYLPSETESDGNQSFTDTVGAVGNVQSSPTNKRQETLKPSFGQATKYKREVRGLKSGAIVTELKWDSESREFVPSGAGEVGKTGTRTLPETTEVWDEYDDDREVSELLAKMDEHSGSNIPKERASVSGVNSLREKKDAALPVKSSGIAEKRRTSPGLYERPSPRGPSPYTISPRTSPYTVSPRTSPYTVSPRTSPYTVSPRTSPYTVSPRINSPPRFPRRGSTCTSTPHTDSPHTTKRGCEGSSGSPEFGHPVDPRKSEDKPAKMIPKITNPEGVKGGDAAKGVDICNNLIYAEKPREREALSGVPPLGGKDDGRMMAQRILEDLRAQVQRKMEMRPEEEGDLSNILALRGGDKEVWIKRTDLEVLKAQARRDMEESEGPRGAAGYDETGPKAIIIEKSTQTAALNTMVDVGLDCRGLAAGTVTTGMNTEPVPEKMECSDQCKRNLACCKSELQKVTSEQMETERDLTLVTTKLRAMKMENRKLESSVITVKQQLGEAQQKPPMEEKATLTELDLFEDPVRKLLRAEQKLLLKNVDLQAKLAYQLISQAYEESVTIFSMTKISLLGKARLTVQLTGYHQDLLAEKGTVDEWKNESERVLAAGGSARSLPSFPHVDIKKFVPEVKPPAPLRRPKDSSLAATVKLAANFDTKEPTESNKGEAMTDVAAGGQTAPNGYTLASGSSPNQSKVPLTSTFTPNVKSDRPGTSSAGVIGRAMSSSHMENDIPGATSEDIGQSGNHHDCMMGGRRPAGVVGGSADNQGPPRAGTSASGIPEQHHPTTTTEEMRVGMKRTAVNDAGSRPVASDQTRMNRRKYQDSIPADHAILDYGFGPGVYPPPFGMPFYPPHMMPMYCPPLGDPTPLFGKIGELIETFSQDAPPDFGGPNPPSFQPGPRGDDARRGGGMLARDPREKSFGDGAPGQAHSGEGFASHPQHVDYGRGSAGPSQYGAPDRRHAQSDSQTDDSVVGMMQAEERMPQEVPPLRRSTPSPYGMDRISPVDSRPVQGVEEDWGSSSDERGNLRSSINSTERSPALDGVSAMVRGGQKAPLTSEKGNIPSSHGVQRPLTKEQLNTQRGHGLPTPHEGRITPSPHDMSRTSGVPGNDGEGVPPQPASDHAASPAAVRKRSLHLTDHTDSARDVMRGGPYPPHPGSNILLPSKIIEEPPSLERSVEVVNVPRDPAEGRRYDQSTVEVTLVAKPPTPLEGTLMASGSGGLEDFQEPLSPETQKVSFNKATIRPPSRAATKKVKSSIRSNLGLDTFENELCKKGERVMVNEWMQGVSAVEGDDKEDEVDNTDGWQKLGGKRKKRSGNDRVEAKPAKASTDGTGKTPSVVEDDFIPTVFSMPHLLKKLQEMFPKESRNSLVTAILKVRAAHRGQLDNVHFNVVIAEVVTALTTPQASAPREDKKRGGGVACDLGQEPDRRAPPGPAKPPQNTLTMLIAKLEEKFPGKQKEELIKAIVQVRKAYGGTLAGKTMVEAVYEITQYMNSLDTPKEDEEKTSCSICLGSLVSVMTVRHLECEHIFHEECIQSWFQKRERTCPICRSHALLQDDFPKLHRGNPQGVRRI